MSFYYFFQTILSHHQKVEDEMTQSFDPHYSSDESVSDDDFPDMNVNHCNLTQTSKISETNLDSSFTEDSTIDDPDIPDLNEKIFPGSEVTVGLQTIIVLARKEKEHWNNEDLDRYLKDKVTTIPKNLEKSYVYPKNAQSFRKLFKSFSIQSKRHYFCRKCNFLCQIDVQNCHFCKDQCKEFIVVLKFPTILKYYCSKPKFKELMQYRFVRLKEGNKYSKSSENAIEDIHDGERYKSLDSKFSKIFSEERNWCNFPYCVTYDGAPCFEVSSKSIWPFNLINYGFPPDVRYKHEEIMFLGCFIGREPSMKIFLPPFLKTLEFWFKSGIEVVCNGEKVISKGALLFVDADSKAREPSRNHLPNGYYACGDCEIKGQHLANAVRYPCSSTLQIRVLKDRTHDSYMEYGRKAETNQLKDNNFEATFGVNGVSPFANMEVCNLAEIFPNQNMHLLWENVLPQIYDLLFSNHYKTEEFSAFEQLETLERRISSVNFQFGTKSLRPFSTMLEGKGWKAYETREFTLFYAVALFRGIIDEDFLKEFAKFVGVIKKFSGKSVFQKDIKLATQILESFYVKMSNFFKPQNITVSCHGIIHLPKYVKSCGPFWVLSGFICENETGNWMRNVTGTSSSQEFMIFMYSLKLKLFASDFGKIIDNQSESMKSLIAEIAPFLLSEKQTKKKGRIELQGYLHCFVHGNIKRVQLNEEESRILKDQFQIEKEELFVYSKISSPLGIFTSRHHSSKKAQRKDSSWVEIESNFENLFGRIIHFFFMKEKMWMLLEVHSSCKIDEFQRQLIEKEQSELLVCDIAHIKSSMIMIDQAENVGKKEVLQVVVYSKPSMGESFVSQV